MDFIKNNLKDNLKGVIKGLFNNELADHLKTVWIHLIKSSVSSQKSSRIVTKYVSH